MRMQKSVVVESIWSNADHFTGSTEHIIRIFGFINNVA